MDYFLVKKKPYSVYSTCKDDSYTGYRAQNNGRSTYNINNV